MIVDDSLTARTVLSRIVDSEDDLTLASVATTAEQALHALQSIEVDVILLDLEMPGIGGLDALPKLIASARGARVLVVSALTVDGAEQTLAALSLGAADTLPKPASRRTSDGYPEKLLSKIRALGRSTHPPANTRVAPTPVARVGTRAPAAALAIGSSTGGIHALGILFRALPRPLGVPILVTQHLPGSFMNALARQLRIASGYDAVIAEDGMELVANRIAIAPGNAHLTARSSAGRLVARLDERGPVNGCMPAVDPMFASLAEELGERALGVVLSGMGRDGSDGAASIVRAGGLVLAQDEATSAVWGMPRAIAAAGLAAAVLPPDQLAVRIAACVGGSSWK